MATVWKYDVPIDDDAHLFGIPSGARIVHAAVGPTTRPDHVSVWVVVGHENVRERRKLQIFGTGHPAPESAIWRATAVEPDRPLVWHVWEVR